MLLFMYFSLLLSETSISFEQFTYGRVDGSDRVMRCVRLSGERSSQLVVSQGLPYFDAGS